MTDQIDDLVCTLNQVIPVRVKNFPNISLAGGQVLIRHMNNPRYSKQVRGMFLGSGRANSELLENLHNAGHPIWLQYERDSLSGTVDYALGFIHDLRITPEPMGAHDTADFVFNLQETTGWGRTYINTSDNAWLSDIDGKKEFKEILNPLWGRHNYVFDRLGSKFSYEFILTNKDEESGNVSSIFDDAQAAFWTATVGTIANDTNMVKKNTNCLKIQVVSQQLDINKTWGSPQDWSATDFFSLYWVYIRQIHRFISCIENTVTI